VEKNLSRSPLALLISDISDVGHQYELGEEPTGAGARSARGGGGGRHQLHRAHTHQSPIHQPRVGVHPPERIQPRRCARRPPTASAPLTPCLHCAPRIDRPRQEGGTPGTPYAAGNAGMTYVRIAVLTAPTQQVLQCARRTPGSWGHPPAARPRQSPRPAPARLAGRLVGAFCCQPRAMGI
jgi:hypothetical protein